MKPSQKAILLNTLVLPGAGHFILKRPILGTLYAAISLCSLGFILLKVITFAHSISNSLSERLANGEDISLFGAIGESIHSDTQFMGYAFIIYLATWLFAIWDAYRIGRNSN